MLGPIIIPLLEDKYMLFKNKENKENKISKSNKIKILEKKIKDLENKLNKNDISYKKLLNDNNNLKLIIDDLEIY